jgi:hypothetical protein
MIMGSFVPTLSVMPSSHSAVVIGCPDIYRDAPQDWLHSRWYEIGAHHATSRLRNYRDKLAKLLGAEDAAPRRIVPSARGRWGGVNDHRVDDLDIS